MYHFDVFIVLLFRTVAELLDYGATMTIRDANNNIALHHAVYSGKLDIIVLLNSHHAEIDAMYVN